MAFESAAGQGQQPKGQVDLGVALAQGAIRDPNWQMLRVGIAAGPLKNCLHQRREPSHIGAHHQHVARLEAGVLAQQCQHRPVGFLHLAQVPMAVDYLQVELGRFQDQRGFMAGQAGSAAAVQQVVLEQAKQVAIGSNGGAGQGFLLKLFLEIGPKNFQLPLEIPLGAAQVGQQRVPLVQQLIFQGLQRFLGGTGGGQGQLGPGGQAGAKPVQQHLAVAAAGDAGQQLQEGRRQ